MLPYKNKEQRKTETHHQQKHKTALWEVKYVISERQLGESVKFRNKETYRINSKNIPFINSQNRNAQNKSTRKPNTGEKNTRVK